MGSDEGVVGKERDVGLEGASLGVAVEAGEDKGGDVASLDGRVSAFAFKFSESEVFFQFGFREGFVFGDGNDEEDSAAGGGPVESGEARDFFGGLDARVHMPGTLAEVKAREAISLPSDHGDAEGFEVLACGLDVEE